MSSRVLLDSGGESPLSTLSGTPSLPRSPSFFTDSPGTIRALDTIDLSSSTISTTPSSSNNLTFVLPDLRISSNFNSSPAAPSASSSSSSSGVDDEEQFFPSFANSSTITNNVDNDSSPSSAQRSGALSRCAAGEVSPGRCTREIPCSALDPRGSSASIGLSEGILRVSKGTKLKKTLKRKLSPEPLSQIESLPDVDVKDQLEGIESDERTKKWRFGKEGLREMGLGEEVKVEKVELVKHKKKGTMPKNVPIVEPKSENNRAEEAKPRKHGGRSERNLSEVKPEDHGKDELASFKSKIGGPAKRKLSEVDEKDDENENPSKRRGRPPKSPIPSLPPPPAPTRRSGRAPKLSPKVLAGLRHPEPSTEKNGQNDIKLETSSPAPVTWPGVGVKQKKRGKKSKQQAQTVTRKMSVWEWKDFFEKQKAAVAGPQAESSSGFAEGGANSARIKITEPEDYSKFSSITNRMDKDELISTAKGDSQIRESHERTLLPQPSSHIQESNDRTALPEPISLTRERNARLKDYAHLTPPFAKFWSASAVPVLSKPVLLPAERVAKTSLLYFGYGVDLSLSFMDRVCPGNLFVSLAKIEDYKFIVDRKGRVIIVEGKGEEVYGMVFEVPEEKLQLLGKKVGSGVKKVDVEGVYVRGKGSQKKFDWNVSAGKEGPVGNVKVQVFVGEEDGVEIDAEGGGKGDLSEKTRRRLNRGILEAMMKGMPHAYVESVLRKWVPYPKTPHGIYW